MTKNKTNLLILIVLTTLFVFTIGYSAWIIINVKEADISLDYNYRDIVYSAYNGQSEDYNHGEGLQPNPQKNGYDLTIIDAGTFTFKHRLKDITPTPEWTTGLPKNAGTYEILILSDNFSSTDVELIVTFTINPISPVKEYGPVITFSGEDYNLNYTKYDTYTGTIDEPQYYDESNNLLSEKPKSKGNYTAKILFNESDNFKETLLEIPIIISDTIYVDPSELSVTVNPEKYTYTGSPITPTIVVKLNGSTLDSQHYEIINLQNNINVGQASFTVKLKSGYDGTLDKTFIISPRELTPIPLEISYVSTIRKFTDICNNQILNNTVDDSGKITGGLILVDAEDRTTQYKANGIVTITNMHDGRHGYGTFGTEDPIYETPTNVYGSTYIVKLAVSDTNYSLRDDTFILKYKTVLIDSDVETYYTIEDAFGKATSKIWFAGDATNTSSYVTTSFTSLLLDCYNSNKTYTLNGVKLIVPYKNSSSTTLADNWAKDTNFITTGNVYSAFIIPSDWTLEVKNSGGIAVAATVGFNSGASVATSYSTAALNRGVLVNNGNINVISGEIYCYGYIKGTGNIELASGTTMQESMTLYDWHGGSATSAMYESVFPINAWSMRNNICTTTINSGASYRGWVYAVATGLGQSIGADIGCDVIGSSSSSNCMFKPINSSVDGHIVKAISTNDNLLSTLNQIDSYNQTRNKDIKDVINIAKGEYTDSTLSMSKNLIIMKLEFSTDLSKPLPISYMDLFVSNGATLELSSSDYLFMPGTSATIEEGAKVTIESGVDITLASCSNIYDNEIYVKYSSGWFNNIDSKVMMNGELIVNGSIGGKIETSKKGALLNVINGRITSIYKSVNNTASPYYYTSSPISSWGHIGSNVNGHFETGYKYYSNGSIWVKEKGTITYVTNNANESYDPSDITLTADGYTIQTLPKPSRIYYTFGGWYLDSKCTDGQEALGATIYGNVTVYAKWIPITYNITYNVENFDGCTPDENLFDTDILLQQYTCETSYNLPELQRDGYNFAGWFFDIERTISVSVINLNTILSLNNGTLSDITLYGLWIDDEASMITINYVPNNDLENTTRKIPSNAINSFVPLNYDSYNNDQESPNRFVGWYTDEACTNAYTGLTEDITEITLYGKWEIKTYTVTIQDDKGLLSKSIIVNWGESPSFDETSVNNYIGYKNDLTKSYFLVNFTMSGSTTNYSISDINAFVVKDNMVFNANWEDKATVTVSISGNGASSASYSSWTYSSTNNTFYVVAGTSVNITGSKRWLTSVSYSVSNTTTESLSGSRLDTSYSLTFTAEKAGTTYEVKLS